MEEHQSSKKRFDFYLSCCVYYFSSYDLRRAKGCLSENFSKRIVRVVLGMCIVNGSLSLSLCQQGLAVISTVLSLFWKNKLHKRN